MKNLKFVLFVVAAVVFAIAAFLDRTLLAVGLAFLAAAHIDW